MVTLEAIREKNIVVYGTGINAVKCIYFLEQAHISIEYLIDGREGIGKFKNYEVYQPTPQALNGKYIIVACAFETYPAIKERLHGYSEFKDFLYYEWLDKKMVFLHGNCHMDIVESFLKSSVTFRKKYAVYPTDRICTGKHIDEKILPEIDVWIHEDIQTSNAFGYEVSDEYIKKYVMPDVFEIVMPHLYGLGAGFFPHAKTENKRNVGLLNGAYENGIFPLTDDVIEQCILEKKSIHEICEYVYKDNIISAEYIKSNFNEYISKIKEREKSWDIKISDFILQHYKYEKLFYDKGHPTNIILKKISEEILKILGIQETIECSGHLDYHEIPIYPWIRKVLGMTWKENYIRKDNNAIKGTENMDISQYIREYIWWCYPDYMEKEK